MTFARLSADGSTVIHESENWQGRFPVTGLPRWIAFYTPLRDRRGRLRTFAGHWTNERDAETTDLGQMFAVRLAFQFSPTCRQIA